MPVLCLVSELSMALLGTARGQTLIAENRCGSDDTGCNSMPPSLSTFLTEAPPASDLLIRRSVFAMADAASASSVLVRPGGTERQHKKLESIRRGTVPEYMLLPLPKEYFLQLAGPKGIVIVSWTTGAPSKGEKQSRTGIALNLALSIRKKRSKSGTALCIHIFGPGSARSHGTTWF